MSLPIAIVLAAVVGYLAGAIPFGYLVARAHGVDILKEGSGNPGATNVGRVVGKFAGRLVFFLDFLKGVAAAGWVRWLPVETVDPLIPALIGLSAAILGHSFSVFLGWRGGKGVATTMGGLIVVMPLVVLIGLLVWVASFFATRYVSLASILFAVSLPVSNLLLGKPRTLIFVSVALAVLIILRHGSNIRRLLNGTENRFVRQKRGSS